MLHMSAGVVHNISGCRDGAFDDPAAHQVRSGGPTIRMLLSVAVACLGYMAGSGRPVGLATRSCVSMKKTVEEAEPADRPEINIALKSIVEFQVRAAPG